MIGCSGLVWTGLVYLGLTLLWLCLDYPQSWALTIEECYSSCVFVSTQDNCTLSSGQPWNRSTINVYACLDFTFLTLFLFDSLSQAEKQARCFFDILFSQSRLSLDALQKPKAWPPNKQQRQGKTLFKRGRNLEQDHDGPLGKGGGGGEGERAVRRSKRGEEPAHASIMQIICYTEDAITNQKVKYSSWS